MTQQSKHYNSPDSRATLLTVFFLEHAYFECNTTTKGAYKGPYNENISYAERMYFLSTHSFASIAQMLHLVQWPKKKIPDTGKV